MVKHGWFPVRAASRRTPSAQDIARLEVALGGALPADYKRFLEHYGQGALSVAKWFPVGGASPWGPWGIADQFLGFSSREREGIEDAATNLFDGEIPPHMLPIAYDPGGNVILLAVSGATQPAGSVWFWDHEQRPSAPSPDEPWRADATSADATRGLYPVAPSFTAFLESLRAKPPTA